MFSRKNFMKKINAIDSFEMGGLVLGFKQSVIFPLVAECFVTDSDFIIMNDVKKEFGRIPRNSLSSIHLEDYSKLTERLTDTGVLIMGEFSLAARQKEQVDDFYLSIYWSSGNGEEEAIFNFTGESGDLKARETESALNKYAIKNI